MLVDTALTGQALEDAVRAAWETVRTENEAQAHLVPDRHLRAWEGARDRIETLLGSGSQQDLLDAAALLNGAVRAAPDAYDIPEQVVEPEPEPEPAPTGLREMLASAWRRLVGEDPRPRRKERE